MESYLSRSPLRFAQLLKGWGAPRRWELQVPLGDGGDAAPRLLLVSYLALATAIRVDSQLDRLETFQI
jgi:hypothetical protein